mmetsp:Transcript_23611/g.44932  ORF Transcript_23611/g.44932 Transcript_23611/m.44932 type:complete len:103 (+) Transcript_23611:70-378(+)
MNGARCNIALLDKILPQSSARTNKVGFTEAATLTFGMRSEIQTGRLAPRISKVISTSLTRWEIWVGRAHICFLMPLFVIEPFHFLQKQQLEFQLKRCSSRAT